MSVVDLQHLYNKAWLFASQAHIEQKMKSSGLPYSTHVAMVANELIFANLNESVGVLDIALPAALLHDVLEDTPTTQEELAGVFGVEVASTVACLSKNFIMPFPRRSVCGALQRILRRLRPSSCATASPTFNRRLLRGQMKSECHIWQSPTTFAITWAT